MGAGRGNGRRVDGRAAAPCEEGTHTPQHPQKQPHSTPQGSKREQCTGNSTAVLPYGRAPPRSRAHGFTNVHTAEQTPIQIQTYTIDL